MTSGLGGRRFFEHEVGRTRYRRVDGRAGRFGPDAVEYSVIPVTPGQKCPLYVPVGTAHGGQGTSWSKVSPGCRKVANSGQFCGLELLSTGSEIFAVPVGTVVAVRSTVAPGG